MTLMNRIAIATVLMCISGVCILMLWTRRLEADTQAKLTEAAEVWQGISWDINDQGGLEFRDCVFVNDPNKPKE